MKRRIKGRPRRIHFDRPIDSEEAIQALVSDPNRVGRHAFYPFLHFELRSRRFRKIKSPATGKVRTKPETKVRPIRIASHQDTYILTHYNSIISSAYEGRITGTIIDDCVLAYRQGKGSNIDFAKEAFDAVRKAGDCVAIAIDLKDFYEGLDHEEIKQQWRKTIGEIRLSTDHYKIFKAITNYAYIDSVSLKRALGIPKGEDLPRPIFRSAREYRETVKQSGFAGGNLIIRNNATWGIPQGSPISATLSNLAMISFDQSIAEHMARISGFYRRYSDDILLVVGHEKFRSTVDALNAELAKLPGKIVENEKKRVVSVFHSTGGVFNGSIAIDGIAVQSRLLQYLGFTFDGKSVRIRSQTISRYWRKATWGIRAAKRRARTNLANRTLFKRKIYRRFSHLGRRNLHTYKRRAIEVFGGSSIKKQFRTNWQKLQDEIKKPLK